jgi:hypothetical protein
MGIDSTTTVVLGSERFKSSQNTNLSLDVTLNGNQKEIIEFDRNVDLSLQIVFDEERQESTIFRPSCKYSFVFQNEFVGKTNYVPYRDNLFYTNAINNAVSQLANPNTLWQGYPQYFEFDFIRTDNNVPGYTQPPNNHLTFINKSASTYNWSHYITYAFDNDFDKPLYAIDPETQTSWYWLANDGLPFYISVGTDQNPNEISFKCLVEHGLQAGEYVQLPFNYNGNNIFQVSSIGDVGYDSDLYIFNIDNIGYTGTTFDTGVFGNFKRIINDENIQETTSKYYVKIHKVLTDADCAVLVKAGFELNNFRSKTKFEKAVITPNNLDRTSVKEGNQSYTLSFNCDIDIKPLRDNQKRPITELFFTTIWKGYFGWTKNLKQGFDFNTPLINNLPNSWWDQTNPLSAIGIPELQYTSSFLPPPANPFFYNANLNVGDIIDGAYCEWNDYEQIEREISDINHKITFNSNYFDVPSDSPPTNPLGYYYRPHSKLTIRVFSDYIEEAPRSGVLGIPDYAYYSNLSNSFRWRDLYTYGFIDTSNIGVDYPFLNGKHYPYSNYIFRLYPEGIGLQNINEIVTPTEDECE